MSIPVVYDTMLFFQAATQPTRTHTSIQAVLDGRVTLCMSAELLAEVRDVLTRPEYQARFPALTIDRVEVFLGGMSARAANFDPVPSVFTWPQHRDDDHVFNLAIHSKATRLVTWETRILMLATDPSPAADLLRRLAPDLHIVTPKTLAEELSQK